MTYEMWRFETERFSVVCTAQEEFDPDLSWDEGGSIAEAIEAGNYDLFCAKVAVYLDGHEVAADYLGNCIYRPDEFVTGHRDPDPMNRNCSIMRAQHGNVSIGHYFPDMVRTAIAEAREALRNTPNMRAA